MKTKFLNLHLLIAIVACLFSISYATAQEAVPDFYKEPGLYPNRDYLNQAPSEHIDPFTGALQLHYTDIHIPGPAGFDISLTRSYNSFTSLNPAAEPALQSGLGWTMHLGRIVMRRGQANSNPCQNQTIGTADNPVIEMPDGSRQIFYWVGGSYLWISSQRWTANCLGTGLQVKSPTGTKYEFTQQVTEVSGVSPNPSTYAWYVTRITDKNGNSITVQYTATQSPKILSIQANDGRSLSFNYSGCAGSSQQHVCSVTGPKGTWTYQYQLVAGTSNRYFLTQVVRPDGTSWGYEYYGAISPSAGSYLLKQVRYPQGGTNAYIYSFVNFANPGNPAAGSAVISQKTSSKGGTWSFAYDVGQFGVNNTTTVNTPAGTTVYKHVGAMTVGSGSVWKIGLLVEKSISNVQTETYDWIPSAAISSESNSRPGPFVSKSDSQVYLPQLSRRTINRNGTTFTTSYSNYDAYGNPGVVTESGPRGGSRTVNLTYYINTSLWIINQVDEENTVGVGLVSRQWDTLGRLLSETRDGVQTSFTYFASGDVSTKSFNRGDRTLITTYSDYYRGIPRSEVQPEGVTISRVVDSAGNVTSETNGEQRTTSFAYDSMNRLTQINPPLGNSTAISYSSTSKSAARGSLTDVINYDSFGYLSSRTVGGIATTYRFDSLGRKTFESYPGQSIGTSFTYDALNRLTRTTHADGTSVTQSYSGNRVSITNEKSNTTTYEYRSYGNPDQQFLMTVSAPVSTASITVNRNGRDLVTSISQAGVMRNYQYDSRYLLVSASTPETGQTTFGRDSAGNMTSKVVGASGTTNFSYDSLNRLTQVTYPSTTTLSVSKTYTKTSKIKQVTSSAGTRSFNYDANDNLVGEVLQVGSRSWTANYSYNSNDQLQAITYPFSRSTINLSPDALGRPRSVGSYVTGATYWPSGQIQNIAYANGTSAAYDQDSRLRVSSIKSTSSVAGTSISSTYSYDSASNLKTVADSVDAGFNRSFDYDALDRLTKADGVWGTGLIQYDGAGNITSMNVGANYSIGYAYSNNRLVSTSGSRVVSYSYDSYGNVSRANTANYTYDDASNFRSCSGCLSSGAISYSYDGLGQRLTINKAGNTTFEFWSAHGYLLGETTPNTGETIEYFYLGTKRVAQNRAIVSPTTTVLTANPTAVYTYQPVVLTAMVSGESPTGTVTFKDGATVLGTSTISNGKASFTTSFSTIGVRSLSASYAGNATNKPSTSSAISLNVSAPVSPPAVVLTSPTANASFTAPATIVISVNATAVSGRSIARVEFFRGTTLVNSDTIAPYSFSLSNVAAGTYSFTARAFDNTGASTLSAPVSITVAPPPSPPTVQLISPTASNTFVAPATINLAANATAATGRTITKVEFFNGTSLLSTDTTAPFSFAWASVAAGTYAVKARATDSAGAVTTSAAVNVTVASGAPTVQLTSPAANASFTPPATVSIAANAVAPPGRSITKVEFFNGTTLLNTDTAAPYAYSWLNVPAGAYSLTAKAYDSSGASAVSAAVIARVAVATTTSWSPTPPANFTVGTSGGLVVSVAPKAGGRLACDATKGCSATGFGKVRFLDGITVIGEADVEESYGVARLGWVPKTAGTRTITAQYLGNTANLPSSVTGTVTVTPQIATQTTWIGTPPATMTVGRAVHLSVLVSKQGGGAIICDSTFPSCINGGYGKVRFLDGATVLGEVFVDAWSYQATFIWVPTTTGARTITAQYLGTTPHTASQATASLTVTPRIATSTTWITSPPSSSTVGRGVHLGVTVTPQAGGSLPCDATKGCGGGSYGRVRFLDGSTVFDEIEVTGPDYRVLTVWTPTTTGPHTVTAQYLGTTPNAPSSAVASITVTPPIATTTTWVNPLPTTVAAGKSVGLAVNVSPTTGGYLACDSTQGCSGTSYGKVKFFDGGTLIDEVLVNPDKLTSTVWVPTAPGPHTLAAQYSGTTPNLPSSVTASTTVLERTPTTVTWRRSPPSSVPTGTSIPLDVIVTPSPGSFLQCDPSIGCEPNSFGTVEFLDGSTVIERTIIRSTDYAGFLASISWQPKVAGARIITAKYLGGPMTAPASAAIATTVTPPSATTTSWVSVPSPTFPVNLSVALEVSVTTSDGGLLKCDFSVGCGADSYGKVRFFDGSTVLGELPLAYNSIYVTKPFYGARFVWKPTTTGVHNITAQFLGTAPHQPSSVTMSFTVN